MGNYKNYLFWKRKNILKIINNEIEIFEYSVDKKINEIRDFLQVKLSKEEILSLEEKAEKEEYNILFKKEKDIFLDIEDYLNELKKETKEEYKSLKDKLEEFFENSDIEFDENQILQVIFEEKILEKDENDIIDIYELPFKYRGTIYNIDHQNKVIKKI
ncbi:hypothetical protein STFE110948_02470 [Streptobacillus felis]|uniref:hypothetical protein n=1 Tax=Streptobacillus felis TaxID=1384509 RepID=UPI0008335954|nr:hypothetical protein [Streptobacillus felis]